MENGAQENRGQETQKPEFGGIGLADSEVSGLHSGSVCGEGSRELVPKNCDGTCGSQSGSSMCFVELEGTRENFAYMNILCFMRMKAKAWTQNANTK